MSIANRAAVDFLNEYLKDWKTVGAVAPPRSLAPFGWEDRFSPLMICAVYGMNRFHRIGRAHIWSSM